MTDETFIFLFVKFILFFLSFIFTLFSLLFLYKSNSEDYQLVTSYWAEELPVSDQSMLCAAIDPTRDYRWHALRCDGTYIASFLCEMRVPDWAIACTNLIQFTNTSYVYDSDTGNIHIVHECSKNVVKTAVCGSTANNDADIQRQLMCDDQLGLVTASKRPPQTINVSKADDLRPLMMDPLKQPKPIKNNKKPNWKKISVANKKYSKIPSFIRDILTDDELMQGDEPVKTIEQISTPANSVSTSTGGGAVGAVSTEGGEVTSTETFSSTSAAVSYSLETESYETSSEDSNAAETRTRREIIAPESSTQPMMSISGGGPSHGKKYSHHAKADFDKYDMSQYKGEKLGKSNPQLYSPQVMRKAFNRPEIMNITTQRSEDKPKTPDMFVPPLLMVKSHFPYYPTHFETGKERDEANKAEVIPDEVPAFNESFYESENSTDDATPEPTTVLITGLSSTTEDNDSTESADAYTHLVENKIEAKLVPETFEMLPVAEALKSETTEVTVTATTEQPKTEQTTTTEVIETTPTTFIPSTSTDSATTSGTTTDDTVSYSQSTTVDATTEVTEESSTIVTASPKLLILPSTVFPQDLIVLQEGLRKRSVTDGPVVLVTKPEPTTTTATTTNTPTTSVPDNTPSTIATIVTVDHQQANAHFVECDDSTTTTEQTTTSTDPGTNTGDGGHKIVKKDHRSCVAQFAHGHHDPQPTVKTVIFNEEPHIRGIPHAASTKTPITITLGTIVTGSTVKAIEKYPEHHHITAHNESSLNNADYEEHKPNRHRILTQEPPSNFMTRVFG